MRNIGQNGRLAGGQCVGVRAASFWRSGWHSQCPYRFNGQNRKRCRAVALKECLWVLHANPIVTEHEHPRTRLALRQTAQKVRASLGQFISDVRRRRLEPKVARTLGYLANVPFKLIEVTHGFCT
jgi:hypothetical protein